MFRADPSLEWTVRLGGSQTKCHGTCSTCSPGTRTSENQCSLVEVMVGTNFFEPAG